VLLGAALLLVLAAFAPSPAAAAPGEVRLSRRVRGQLVAREKAGVPAAAVERALARAGALSSRPTRSTRARVLRVAPGELAQVERVLRESGLFKSVERDYLAAVAETPNDPYFLAQWGLLGTGTPDAWDLTTGSAQALAAVLDTGVDFSHPDLAGQIVAGYDFVNDDADPSDDHGHGTHMAGIIAALQNNGIGVSGVAPDSPLLAVKVLGADGIGPYSAVADGITYAADQGARVINLSLAGTAPSALLQDAVAYARGQGAVVVAAMGNDASSDPVYPAATSGVVAVGAVNSTDALAGFSNTGAWISHVSPGVDVLTTELGGGYWSSSGTSPAAAFSSGIFSLLFAFEPSLDVTAAIARVESGAIDLGSGGWDPSFGWGRVDAHASLVPGEPSSPRPDFVDPSVQIVSPVAKSLASGLFSVEVAAHDDQGVSHVDLFVDNRKHASEVNAPYSFVVDATLLAPGKHKLRAYAYDEVGNWSKTKNVKVWMSPGAGLLVTRAKVRSDRASITASFALPEGSAFDPAQHDVVVRLSSASGVVFEALVTTADMETSPGGKVSASVSPTVPSNGNVRLKASETGAQPLYKLKLKASQLTPMAPSSNIMNLTLLIGDAALSQSLTFRPQGTGYTYP